MAPLAPCRYGKTGGKGAPFASAVFAESVPSSIRAAEEALRATPPPPRHPRPGGPVRLAVHVKVMLTALLKI
jgi:hypothetical protein